MVESHCDILWDDNSGADLGRCTTENCATGLDGGEKQAIISQYRLRFKVIGIWIKKYLTTYAKCKWRAFRYAYAFDTQDDGAEMLLVNVKMVRTYTRAGWSDINSKLENMKMYHFKHEIPKANLHITEWMNDIYIFGEIYSKIVRQKFALYSTSSFPLFKDYMETGRSEWEEEKEITADQVRAVDLNKYNTLLTSGRCTNKNPNYTPILALVGLNQKLADDSKKSSDKSNTFNRDTT